MKRIIMLLMVATMVVACQKESVGPNNDPLPNYAVPTIEEIKALYDEQVNSPQPKIVSHVNMLRRNTSLRFSVSVIFVMTQDSTAWLAYELPKVNSAFNPHAPYVRLPEGYYAFGAVPGGMMVDGWSAGDCYYYGGNSWLSIIPRGGVIIQYVCWKGGQTINLYGGDAAMKLNEKIPDTGVIKFY